MLCCKKYKYFSVLYFVCHQLHFIFFSVLVVSGVQFSGDHSVQDWKFVSVYKMYICSEEFISAI